MSVFDMTDKRVLLESFNSLIHGLNDDEIREISLILAKAVNRLIKEGEGNV